MAINKKEIRLEKIDHVAVEALFLIAFLLFSLIAGGIASLTEVEGMYTIVYKDWFVYLVGAIAFVADVIFTAIYYSYVRRIKARAFFKTSWIGRLCIHAKDIFFYLYDHGNEILKGFVPVLLLGLINIAFAKIEGPWFVVAIVIDLIAAWILYQDLKKRREVVAGIEKITEGDLHHQIDTNTLHGENLQLANAVNRIGEGIKDAVETSMKDERMKADLITNVSHDIKTPLTSIINYVDLIKREEITDPKIKEYIRVLDEKSQRLKQLTDDLVEASKISSGNIILQMEKINLVELLHQTEGEFSEKFEERHFKVVETNKAAEPFIYADSRRIWRVMENLFNNICKYGMEYTRVYIDLLNCQDEDGEKIVMILKNISNTPLNCNPDELTERFIRGDESRTTEGSGLGLSIAKNLVEIQNGQFEIQLDGDLFKVMITFSIYKDQEKKMIEAKMED